MYLYDELVKRADRPVQVGLIGAGKFGSMFLSQVPTTLGLEVKAIADLDPDRARQSCRTVGWSDAQLKATEFFDSTQSMIDAGGIDVLVEATGNPIAGIAHAKMAIAAKIHIVMVNVEADVLAGGLLAKQAREAGLAEEDTRVIWRSWPVTAGYRTNEVGEVACKIYEAIPARRLWNLIMASTYDYAEPGFILIDRINEMNNNWFCEDIRATNPCGEQPLPPYGSCLLGSVNLTRFVDAPFTDSANFDWERFRKVVSVFSRMLDNVVEIHGLPLDQQGNEIRYKRRHGMGFLGLGSALTMLQMKYGDSKSLEFTERVAREMAQVGWETGLELAKSKDAAAQRGMVAAVSATRPSVLLVLLSFAHCTFATASSASRSSPCAQCDAAAVQPQQFQGCRYRAATV